MGVILIGIFIVTYAEMCKAECAWVLWKSTTVNYEEASKRWELIIAVPTYRQCLDAKSNLITSEIEVYEKISKNAKLTSQDHIVAIMQDKPNQKRIINTLDYYCFPDTIDPRK